MEIFLEQRIRVYADDIKLHFASKSKKLVQTDEGCFFRVKLDWANTEVWESPTPYFFVVNTRVTRTAPHGSHVMAQVELSTKMSFIHPIYVQFLSHGSGASVA